jgi:anti-sigma B factor antagonist
VQPTQLEIRREQHGATLILAARGEIDLATVPGLREALERAAADGREFWLDLSEVEFMDSTGLTALVSCHHAVNDGRVRFAVICPPGAVWRALEISGLHEFLPLYPSRGAAGVR